MIKIEQVEAWGFEHAIRGMRNPMNSWEKSDSELCRGAAGFDDCRVSPLGDCPRNEKFQDDVFCIGKNDLSLMQRLYRGGTEHRKFMRQIMVSMDITAPLYWWKEFDTYKVGTVANSCSTMHKIHSKEFTPSDFSTEHLQGIALDALQYTIDTLNHFRQLYLSTKEKAFWLVLIQLLPSSYNQRRTVTMNYEVAANIIQQRTGHKLDEWHKMVDVLTGLPYMKAIMQPPE